MSMGEEYGPDHVSLSNNISSLLVFERVSLIDIDVNGNFAL